MAAMKKTILHVCLSRGCGGLELYPVRVAKVLQERGWQVYCLCLENSPVATKMTELSVKTFQVQSKGDALKKIFRIKKWLKQHNIQRVHCHKSGDILVTACLSLMMPIQVVFTEHMGISGPKKDLFHRLTYRHVKKVLSISQETYRRNIKALPVSPERIEKLWIGVETPVKIEDKAIIRDRFKLNHNDIIIALPGRITRAKGHLNLLVAFKFLTMTKKNIHLLFIGGVDEYRGADPEVVSTLQHYIAEHNLQEKVTFTNYTDDVFSIINAVDIVCIPSKNEAFGLTVVESMAARKAVVAANTGGIPEVLADAGILVDPENPQMIAISLEKLVDDAAFRDKLAEQAGQRFLKEFRMDAHVDKLEQIYYYTCVPGTKQ